MKIDVVFLPSEVEDRDLSDTVCIVLDIFRATSCIVTAFQHGCHTIFPVLTLEEAQRLAKMTAGAILAGERHSLKLEGCRLGNSPFEFSREMVQDRKIIMTTSNGTVAIRATDSAYRTYIGSFLNVAAVCREVEACAKDVLIVCAGTDGRFSLEDALCAGCFVETLSAVGCYLLKDAAIAALFLYEKTEASLLTTAAASVNGQRLNGLDRWEDIEYCLQLDRFSVVPRYQDRKITVNV